MTTNYGIMNATEQKRTRNQRWDATHIEARRGFTRKWHAKSKVEVLSHYGPDGKLQCAWPECIITDIDMLTLDHVDNSGADDRRIRKVTYSKLRKANYPPGFQTLCHNHQWKKEIGRRTDA